ncbi:hypothetical protein B6U74_04820 [Candidatus Bathyarchaeota archaeon ex4484_205]|nr:MAG: hypothetical protein B6U74_04820 [Candidatus Bathyarchaeota archaeon ex4484_205]RLG66487.1 MAG: hypothetical protein DRN93_06225 [archaeon]
MIAVIAGILLASSIFFSIRKLSVGTYTFEENGLPKNYTLRGGQDTSSIPSPILEEKEECNTAGSPLIGNFPLILIILFLSLTVSYVSKKLVKRLL